MNDNNNRPGDVTLPVKRTTGETIEERLTANAYHNILPARYQHKDENGDVVETQEELFERIPKNVAVPDIVYKADQMGITVEVTPDQIQPRRNESDRQDVAEEVFGEGTSLDDDVTTELTEHNAWAFAYDTLVPELENDELREHVESVYEMYYEQISNLKFTPNSPTWMGAGNEIQQLSACFVNSPADDMTDIHETAKEAALTFQSGGGVGYDFSQLRPYGDPVGSTGGISSGPLTFMETFDQVCGTVAQGGCVANNERIMTQDGYVPFAEVHQGSKLTDAPSERTVYGSDGETYSVRQSVDSGPMDAVTVQTAEGYSITVTPNHPLLTIRGGDTEFVPAGELEDNDPVLLSLNETTTTNRAELVGLGDDYEPHHNAHDDINFPTKVTDDFAKFVGILWADGDINYSTGKFGFSLGQEGNFDQKAIEFITNYLDSLNLNYEISDGQEYDKGKYDSIRVNSVMFIDWMVENGITKETDSLGDLPEVIYRSPSAFASFLGGLTCDASVEKDAGTYSYSTKSGELAHEIQDLLLNLGIPSKVSEKPPQEDRFSDNEQYTVSITPGVGARRFEERVEHLFTETADHSADAGERQNQIRDPSIVSTILDENFTKNNMLDESVDKAAMKELRRYERGDRTPSRERLVDLLEKVNVEVPDFLDGRFYFAIVDGVENVGTQMVSDIEVVDGEPEFVASNFTVHNTRRGAQMGVMHVWHPDIIQFIHAKNKDVSLAHTLKLNDPDDFTHNSFAEALEEARDLIGEDGKVPKFLRNAVEGHLSNFNISVGITDDFMEALDNGEMFTLKNPRTDEPHIATEETKELYERFGLDEYVTVGEELEIPAEEIWSRIIDGAYENGEPGVVYIERMNKTHSFDTEKHPEHQINATNPCGEQELEEYESCLVGDQTVLTDDGVRQIEDFKDGSLVTSDSGVSEIATDARLIPQGEKDVVRVEVDGKMPITCTPDHVFMTDKGEVEAQDLIDEDAKVKWMGNNPLTSTVDMDSEDAWRAFSIGWIHGDGWLTENSIGVSFNAEDGDFEVKDRVLEQYHELFGERKPLKDDEESYQEQTDSSGAFETADELGFNYAKATERSLPDVFYEYSENEQLAFLRGLFTADAGVGGKTNKQIKYATSSYELADEIQKVLGSFGIQTRRYVNTFDDRNDQIQIKISKASARKYMEYIGLETSRKQEQFVSAGRDYVDNEYLEVVSIEDAGTETVYDLNVPETNVFHTNGMLVHNCNLGHINLSTLVAEQNGSNPDFRAFMDEKGVDPDELTEEEARPYVEEFLEYAVNWEDMNERITSGIRFLDNVITMSDFPVEKYNEKVMGNRKVGLGIMGLAQMFIQMGVKYGSPVANEITRQVMTYINHEGKQVSAVLADERGVFDEWHKSKYADPTEYAEWFEHHTGLEPDEYEDGFELRNHDVTTIAPTGTTSMLGNTSGGCEPLYNVAYYKNVSQDVQGDEMLVEFDDYFLRTLDANDIDVEAVKREAQELMENNEFDGAESLETVPDSISELFITTGELTAKEHAGVQCAAQDGVDASISKTTNAANDSTREDADEVFRYIYENGGKGVTYYRDGTRSKQVLTTRAQNTEFSDMDDDEAAEFIREKIEDVFGDVETFVAEQFDGQSVVETAEQAAQTDLDVESVLDTQDGFITVRDRPDELHGVTQRIQTGYGKVYVTINVDSNGNPFELIANIGNSGGYTNSFTESLAKTCSIALRSGVDPEEIVTELRGTRSPKIAWHGGEQIQSIPDAIGYALMKVIGGEVTSRRSEGVDTDVSAVKTKRSDKTSDGDDTQSLIESGESPECPSCGSLSLYYSEGCKTCESCGWSEC